MFPCSSNIFNNFPINSFLFYSCFLSNILNIRYNLCNIGEMLRQYNINIDATCFSTT